MLRSLREPGEIQRIARYYLTGLLNFGFGYALFALLIYLGLNVFVAQIVGHLIGATFNYFSYSRLTFVGQAGNGLAFIGSYALNYIISLGLLWALLTQILSPYLAGFITIVAVSLLNYFVLKRFVFSAPSKAG